MTRLAALLALLLAAAPGAAQTTRAPLGADGTVPLWLAAGPFEQPLSGFGVPGDADAVGEAAADPAEGQPERSPWALGGRVAWRPAAPGRAGFVDFHAAFADVPPGDGPEAIWWAKAGYAATTLHSPRAQDVLLLMGSNSRLRVRLNGEPVHAVDADRNAVADEDTLRLRLREGANRLLVKVGQSHRNEAVQFFVPLRWDWGFYARVVRPDGRPTGVEAAVRVAAAPTDAALGSSFFFREGAGGLRQRFDLTLTRRAAAPGRGEARLTVGTETVTVPLDVLPFGVSRWEVWGPAVEQATPAVLTVAVAGEPPLRQAVTLEPQPRYELLLMLTSHTDVGYTHPQPTVAEKHALLLDRVVARAEAEPDFRWTVETVWQLEQFVTARSAADVERLMALVRAGRVAVSPVYANPFTGWVSEEELLRSFDLGRAYADRYALPPARAALSNDVPGFSWALPGALAGAGVRFLATGINEVYSDYAFQRALPKAFHWQGADGATVLTYRSEAYNEGQTVGLVKGVGATVDRLRERLLRHRARGTDFDLVLLTTAFGDNGPIPTAELDGARAWNAAYAYPRIVVSTLDQFADAFAARYSDALPTLRGDWTSDWDVLYQGELARTVRQRRVQHALPLAEAMSTAAWLADGLAPLQPGVDTAMHHLLQYSAHGSGLEYGYGSPEENAITMDYRESYVESARLATEAVAQRATQRLVAPIESFETEALYVFNAHGAPRDAPLEVQFPRESAQRYRVVDAATGAERPSHQDATTLRFVARGLPAVGSAVYRLEPRRPASDAPGALRAAEGSIENGLLRLTADPRTGALTSVRDLRTGAELVRPGAALPFGMPVRSVFGDSAGAQPLGAAVRLSVVDEAPARLRLVVERAGEVVSRVVYSLWEGLDRVDVEASVDLGALRAVERTEEIALAFPFALDAPDVQLGLLGGFARPDRDRLPGARRDMFSVRQAVALTDAARSVTWAAVDSRVVRLHESPGEAPTLVAVLANHFPEAWNRNEENAGVWPLRFSFTHRPGGFDAALADDFGRSVAQAPAAYPTWLVASETVRPVLALDGDAVHLQAFQAAPDGESVLVRLRNPRPDAPARVLLDLPGHDVADAVRVGPDGETPLARHDGKPAATLGPNEQTTLRLRLRSALRTP
jgi:hypothetical protein